MRQLKLLGLALMAVFTSTAALSASASAMELPENLPALGVGQSRTWSSKNVGNTEFRVEGEEPVVCTAAVGEGTETTSNAPLGLFHITFEKCTTKAAGTTIKCTGLGDATGVSLTLGTWHLVFDKVIEEVFNELASAVLFLNEAVHFACAGILLVEVLVSETLCLALKPTEPNFTHEFHCFGLKTGTNPVEEWGTESQLQTKEGKDPLQKVSVNHAEKELPAIQLWLGTITYGVKVSADE